MTEQEILEQFWWYTKDLSEQQKEITNEVLIKAYDLGYWEGHAEHADSFYCD